MIIGCLLLVNFVGFIDQWLSKLNVSYCICSKEFVGGKYLYFDINEEIQISFYFIVNVVDG